MSKITQYDSNFYTMLEQTGSLAAGKVLPYVFSLLPAIKSVTDIGCGAGTWLSICMQLGVERVCGIDGDWAEEHLKIPLQSFVKKNIEDGLPPVYKSDLAISLEVAEHLDEKVADDFINYLTQTADFILFSAAIPKQGGQHHVNEQWPSYWLEKFKQFGYVGLDVVRRHIWNEQEIPVWYKQNILLVVKQERLSEVNLQPVQDVFAPIDCIHPELYLYKIAEKLQHIYALEAHMKHSTLLKRLFAVYNIHDKKYINILGFQFSSRRKHK